MLENKYEKLAWKANKKVMGIDEAGRGPLCGPLVVACCVLPKGYKNDEINDSKKLSDKKRRELFKIITKDALFFSIEIVAPKIIDELNILEATRSAMQALSLKYKVDYVLTDAVENGDLGFKSGKGIQEWSQKDVAASKRKLNDHLIKNFKDRK